MRIQNTSGTQHRMDHRRINTVSVAVSIKMRPACQTQRWGKSSCESPASGVSKRTWVVNKCLQGHLPCFHIYCTRHCNTYDCIVQDCIALQGARNGEFAATPVSIASTSPQFPTTE